ncbi:MAG: ABC transporter ATP-binding protein [bacterium]|nr:ABC transporter ATP-binding protein [bacterium]
MNALLEIEDLEVRFPGSSEEIVVLDRVNIRIGAGEIFGVIGETGAGKSLTAWAAVNLLPVHGRVTAGEVRWKGRSISAMTDEEVRRIRGNEVSLITQNPLAALNPMSTVGHQIVRVIRAHERVGAREARRMAFEALRAVGIPDPERRFAAYPHQLSGGMAQRILIAMAMINRPQLLIADEPTTGLDVTLQAEILDLMTGMVRDHGASIWLITHDLGVIANYTERAAVMFAGQVVETTSTRQLFEFPRHPYTRGFLDAVALERDDDNRLEIAGSPPDLRNRPAGCQFAYRCPLVENSCLLSKPPLLEAQEGHLVRCPPVVKPEELVAGERPHDE